MNTHEHKHHDSNHHSEHHHHDDHDGHNTHDHSHHNMDHHQHDEHAGHDGHDHAHHGDFKKLFLHSLVLGLPILILSPMMGVSLPFQFSFKGSDWLVAILASLLFFYGGKPFIMGAKDEIKSKSPAMMTLITLGISVSYFYSMYAFIMNHIVKSPVHIMDFFWELASLILIMLLGHWIEMEAVSSAGNALQKMAELLPSDALRLNDDQSTTRVALADILVGDHLIVKAGDKVPADGIIIDGSSSINESMITGESKAVTRKVHDKVIGGSVNGSGSLVIEVTGTGASGYLAQVMQLVNDASNDKSNAESMADVVAKNLFYFALVVGVIALIVWTGLSGPSVGIERMVTVLVIACPHALGLAIPLVVARSTSIGAQNGLLVKSRQSLETAENIDVILMDKTGTLTEGNFVVTAFGSSTDQLDDQQVLSLFAALEKTSSHPLAVGILEKTENLNLPIPNASNVHTLAGIGLEGDIDSKTYRIVNMKYLQAHNIAYDPSLFEQLASQGYSMSYLVSGEENLGYVAQGDEIKPDAIHLIASLQSRGIKPIMLTGDNKQAAELIAKNLGLDTVHAEMLPEDKESMVRHYQSQGNKVMMVGDGVNDAPSLARADVGLAIGAGTDVAIDSADVILVQSNPSDILHFLDLAHNTSRKMKQNLVWGAGYNFIAVPLAAGVLAKFGILLSPAFGAVLMSLSTVIVAINALLLRIRKD